MRRNDKISTLLGVTQQEMARLLKLSYSHYSMYEIGKRDLPLAAKELVAGMLSHIHGASVADKTPSNLLYDVVRQQQLEERLKENKYRQMVLERKIEAAERKYVAHVRREKLLPFFSGDGAKKYTFDTSHVENWADKTTGALEKKAMDILVARQLELEDLVVVGKSLREKLDMSQIK